MTDIGRPSGSHPTTPAWPFTRTGVAEPATRENWTAWRTAGAARQLPHGGDGAPEDPADLLEGHRERVVEDERHPLRRRQLLQHDQEREADRVREQRLPLRPAVVLARHHRLRPVRVEGLLGVDRPRAKLVEADPRDDRGQPASDVLDAAGVRAGEPEPRLLDGVLRLARRSQHPVGDRAQARPVLLELPRQLLVVDHAILALVRWTCRLTSDDVQT
jgi:hypothetical protein